MVPCLNEGTHLARSLDVLGGVLDGVGLPWELLVVGFIGSCVGGLIFNILAGNGLEFHWTGLLGSILGAIVVLLIYGPIRDQLRKRSDPGPAPDPLAERHHKR